MENKSTPTLSPLLTVPSLLMTAFMVLLVLRLLTVIDWSWWIITLPIWILPVGYMLAMLFYLMLAITRGIGSDFTSPKNNTTHESGSEPR